MKLTKKYYIEGVLYNEGTEFVIASDGETETINATDDEPKNEVDFGIIDEKKAEVGESEKTDEVNEEEVTTEEDK